MGLLWLIKDTSITLRKFQTFLKLCARNTRQWPNPHILLCYTCGYRTIKFLSSVGAYKILGSLFSFSINQSCTCDHEGLCSFPSFFWGGFSCRVWFSIAFQAEWFYPVFGFESFLVPSIGKKVMWNHFILWTIFIRKHEMTVRKQYN